MSDSLSSILPSKKYMTANPADQFLPLELNSTSKNLISYGITDFLDQADRFDEERQASEYYRVMGNFNYVSLLRDLKQTYTINSLSELFTDANYQGKAYNFDYYFDIQVVYPTQFLFRSKIDDNKTLYDIKYEIISSVTYQQVRSAYQENTYSEFMWNILSNQVLNLSQLTTNISDLNINIPLNEVALYITLKDKTRLKVKSLPSTYSINNLNLHSATTYGYDDSLYNTLIYNNIPIDQAIIGLNDPLISGAYDVEFLSSVRHDLLLLFNMNNIELSKKNIELNAKYLKAYLGVLRDKTDMEYIVYQPPVGSKIVNGGCVIFDQSDFTWQKTENMEHQFFLDYDYTQDNYIQVAKEGIGYLDDFINVYLLDLTGNKGWYQISRMYVKNNNFEIICRVSDVNNFTKYSSVYSTLLDTLPNPLRFNNITHTNLATGEILLNVINKQVVTQVNNTTSNLHIFFKYNPFITIKFKEYSTALQITDDIKNISIPDYALKINNLYKWRNLLDKGFIEPDTAVGFDYPFLNDNTYIDNNFRFYVQLDKSNVLGRKIFSDFSTNIVINNFTRNKDQAPNC